MLSAGAFLAVIDANSPPRGQYQSRLDRILRIERFWTLANFWATQSCDNRDELSDSGIKSVSFIFCPGFDSEPEPVIHAIIVVAADGSVQRRALPADPYIYHHKWLFVDDDYLGFDVEQSRARSKQWIGLGDVDRSRIGRLGYWERVVVKRLGKN